MAMYWLQVLMMLVWSACSARLDVIRLDDVENSEIVLPDVGGSFTCGNMHIVLGKFMKEGLHGQVFEATDADGNNIVLKQTTRGDEDFEKECTMQNQLAKKVPGHVPRCLGLCSDGSVPGKTNILVMELVVGAVDLTSWMNAHTDDDVKKEQIAAQTLFILNVMIKEGIANNDQMPNKNILVDESNEVWFIDFGLACYKYNCPYANVAGIESGMIYTVLKEFRKYKNQDKYWTWDQLNAAYCCLSTVGNYQLKNEITDIATTHGEEVNCRTCDDDPEDCRACKKFLPRLSMIKASR